MEPLDEKTAVRAHFNDRITIVLRIRLFYHPLHCPIMNPATPAVVAGMMVPLESL